MTMSISASRGCSLRNAWIRSRGAASAKASRSCVCDRTASATATQCLQKSNPSEAGQLQLPSRQPLMCAAAQPGRRASPQRSPWCGRIGPSGWSPAPLRNTARPRSNAPSPASRRKRSGSSRWWRADSAVLFGAPVVTHPWCRGQVIHSSEDDVQPCPARNVKSA